MLIPRQKLCLIGFCFALCAHAQQNRGTIFGTVTDTSGATMPGTRITVTDITTNAVFTTESNQAGFYSAPGLAVGEYQVAGERPGFKKAVRSGITLQVDQRAEVNLTMDLGAVAESVEVVGQAPLVDTGGATVGEVIDNRRVLELPVNGRNALSLVFLTPAVKSNAGTTNSGFA